MYLQNKLKVGFLCIVVEAIEYSNILHVVLQLVNYMYVKALLIGRINQSFDILAVEK